MKKKYFYFIFSNNLGIFLYLQLIFQQGFSFILFRQFFNKPCYVFNLSKRIFCFAFFSSNV